jgi:hypothetical protein
MKKILSLYPESPVCVRVWPDMAKILARFWPSLARSGQILARILARKIFLIFFLILLIQMFNCDNIHTLRLWKRHYLVSH